MRFELGHSILHKNTEVLVIGSGGGGVRCGIELVDHGVDVIIIGKSRLGDAHTVWAKGGINAALGNMDPDDSWERHHT